jgi:hypothetical protein
MEVGCAAVVKPPIISLFFKWSASPALAITLLSVFYRVQ